MNSLAGGIIGAVLIWLAVMGAVAALRAVFRRGGALWAAR
jgi:hypothetical protein